MTFRGDGAVEEAGSTIHPHKRMKIQLSTPSGVVWCNPDYVEMIGPAIVDECSHTKKPVRYVAFIGGSGFYVFDDAVTMRALLD